jgi:hypothetical protein
VKKFCLGIYCQGSFLSERSENVLPWYLLSRLFPFGAEWECFALVFIVKALSFRCGVKKLCLGIYSCCTMGFANNGFSQWSNQNLVRQLFWMLDGWRSTWVVFSCPCYEKMISIQMLHERGRLALKHCCKVVWPSVLVGGVFTWSTGIFVLTCVWHDSRRDTLHTVVTHCRDTLHTVKAHCRESRDTQSWHTAVLKRSNLCSSGMFVICPSGRFVNRSQATLFKLLVRKISKLKLLACNGSRLPGECMFAFYCPFAVLNTGWLLSNTSCIFSGLLVFTD